MLGTCATPAFSSVIFNTTRTSINAFVENRERKKSVLSQPMHSVVTALALRGVAVLLLTLLTSVLGRSGGVVTQPGPVTCFSPGTRTSVSMAVYGEFWPQKTLTWFFHTSVLCLRSLSLVLYRHVELKKWMCSHEIFLPELL